EWMTPLLCPVWWRATSSSASATTSRTPGRRTSACAVARPTMPPPMIAMSAVAILPLLGSQPVPVDAGHVPHVVPDGMVLGRPVQVLQRLLPVAGQVVIDTNVEVGVEQLPVEALRVGRPGAGGSQHVVRLQVALEQVIDLPHRHAAVVADLEDRLPRLRDPVGLRHAHEAPDGILDVVTVEVLVPLELPAAILV